MKASRKVLVVLDAATNTIGIVDGFVFAEFSDREGAMRFVRARGLKLADRSEPRALSADAVRRVLEAPDTPTVLKIAAEAAEAEASVPPGHKLHNS